VSVFVCGNAGMNCGRPLDGGGGGWGRHSAQWMVGWRMEGGLRATLILFSRSSKDNLRDLVATITWWAHTHTTPSAPLPSAAP
jgi:hypothetical protein